MKYFAYLRKSSEQENRQAQSIETQKRIILDFISKNPNIEIVDFIVETRSAKSDGNRPNFTDMLKRYKKGEAEGLFVTHIDRIARNLIEAGMVQKLNDLGLIKEVQTPDRIYRNQTDFYMMGMELTNATYYSRNLSKRVKEGIESKLKKGEYVSGRAPIGYLNHNGNLIQDLKRINYIKEIFKMYSSGKYSLREITDSLYSNGFRTRSDKKVVKSKIHQIIKNPIYYGVMTFNGIQYQGNFDPIINKSLFELAQEVLTGKNRPKKYHHEFLYKDFLFCDKCGCKITSSIKKGKFKYYYCTNGKGGCEEHKKYLNEKNIENIFLKFFEGFELDPELATISLNKYLADKQVSENDNKVYKETLEKELKNINKKINKLEDMYIDSLITKENYVLKRKSTLNEKIKIEESIKQLSNTRKDTSEPLIKLKNTLTSLKKIFLTDDDIVKTDLIRSVLWNCTINKEKIKETNLKKPYLFFKNMQKCTDLDKWLPRMDSYLTNTKFNEVIDSIKDLILTFEPILYPSLNQRFSST